MNKSFRNYFWILISAMLAIFSHPIVIMGWDVPDLGYLGFIAYVPLFYVLFHSSKRQSFKLSFFFGCLFYLGTLHWLYKALNGFGHLPPALSVLLLLVLVALLALYLSCIILFSRWIESRLGLSHLLTLPVLWVAVEWCRTHWPLGGFPWAQAGYSQWKFLEFIQSADVLGVYGATALLIGINLAFTQLILNFQNSTFTFRKFFMPGIIFLLFALNLTYGFQRKSEISQVSAQAEHFNLALLQGNIPQDEKWLIEKADEILASYQAMTLEAFAHEDPKVELVIWPEAAVPYEIARDLQTHIDRIGNFPGDVLLGAVTYENKGLLPEDSLYSPLGYPIYNSALLLRKGPQLGGAYFKHHLVPYGEYIPLKDVIPFVGKLTEQMGEFQEGKEYNLLQSGAAKIGVLICYEDIFPQIAAQLTQNGANLLVNLTNDAWYGDSSALPQHLSFSAFRAIENRRSVVRATNTGMTASFDAVGKIWASAESFERKIVYDKVPLLTQSAFYSQHGDIFAYACLAISGLLMLGSLLCRKN